LNKDWEPTPLGDLLTRSDKVVNINPLETYKQVTVRLWGNGVILRDEVSGSEISSAKRYEVKPGQFILSKIDARNGAFGLVPPDLDEAIVSGDFPVFDINSDRLEPKYLEWKSKTGEFVDLCRVASEGTTNRVRLKEDKFLRLSIALPVLPEQRRIVAKIEALAFKIAEARSLRYKAAEETDSLVISLHVNLAGKRVRELREVVVLDEDAVSVNSNEEYPQVGIKSFGSGLFKKRPTKGADTTYKTFNRLYAGALVLSQVKGWEGAIAVAGDDFAGWFVSPEYRTFRCIASEARPDYLFSLVRTEWFWTRLQTATRGVGARRERTRPEQFLSIKIPMPDLDQQKSAIAVFKRLDALKGLQSETAAELDALLPAILARAFKGEL